MNARTALFASATLLAGLSGCNNMVVRGKVIPGEIGRVVRVADTDERLEEDGLGEIQVSVSQGGTPGHSAAALGTAVSKPDGTFRISIPNNNLRSGRISVYAEGESIFKVQNLVDFPRDGESLLVQVIQRTTPAPGETGSEPEAEKSPE